MNYYKLFPFRHASQLAVSVVIFRGVFNLSSCNKMNLQPWILSLLVFEPFLVRSFVLRTIVWHQNAQEKTSLLGSLGGKDTKFDVTTNDELEQSSPLGSLDLMLEDARKRHGINYWFRLQAAWDAPVLKLEKPYPNLKSSLVVTVGDTALAITALLIHAKGFALGYIIGKLTAGPCREILRPGKSVHIALMPMWPVIWAIGLDQLL